MELKGGRQTGGLGVNNLTGRVRVVGSEEGRCVLLGFLANRLLKGC